MRLGVSPAYRQRLTVHVWQGDLRYFFFMFGAIKVGYKVGFGLTQSSCGRFKLD